MADSLDSGVETGSASNPDAPPPTAADLGLVVNYLKKIVLSILAEEQAAPKGKSHLLFYL
jgi:hypothetical protein